MELTRFTDYSLRALIYVALEEEGKLSSIKDIAAAYKISENHLVKVVHKLGALGYLKTFRGRGGGVSLGKDPDAIRVGDIVREMEGMGLAECFPERNGTCCLAGICNLQAALGRAASAFLAELDKVTLSDLIEPQKAVRKRLLPDSD